MNNRYEFRVWDNISEYYFIPCKIDLIKNVVYEERGLGCDGQSLFRKHMFKDVVFEQWTGLLDKNGKKIFEGDTVKWFNRYNNVWYSKEVIYDSDFACFTIKGDIIDWVNMGEHLEIIGNKHEGVK